MIKQDIFYRALSKNWTKLHYLPGPRGSSLGPDTSSPSKCYLPLERTLDFQDAGSCDGEIRDLRDSQQDLSKQLEDKQLDLQQLQGSTDTLDGDVERLLEHKQKVQCPSNGVLSDFWKYTELVRF